MPAKPAPLSPPFPALAPARLGRAERIALASLAILAALLLAAWQIPPLLDWSRYRGAIAAYATARLARPVSIAGGVRLTLLPRPLLLADHVTLADRGDGISATIGTLRLEVALSSLLAGRVVPTALALDDPTATLPWPPPRGVPHLPPRTPGAFAATVSGGTLIVGGLALHDITASLRTDPETGAFAAQGNARVAGLPWRFTALLGAPDANGVSPVDLTLDGRSAPRPSPAAPDMQGTGGAFQGRLLADGAMAGTLLLRGPDLSRLGAGPAVPWQIQGAVSGDGLTWRAPALDLRLGGAPGQAAVTLLLSRPAALTLRARLGRLPAGAWLGQLAHALMQGPAFPAFAADLDIAAAALQTSRALLQAPALHLVLGPGGARVPAASILLPGGTRLSANGAVGAAGFSGDLAMHAPSLHAGLDWLVGAPVGLPASVLARAELHGAFAASASRLGWTALGGTLDGSPISGSLTLRPGARPELEAVLRTRLLPLAGWAWPPAAPIPPLAAMLAPFAAGDAAIRLTAEQVDWPGLPLRHAELDAAATPAGLALHHLGIDLPGGHLDASGKLAEDGRVVDGRLDLAAPDAAALPAAWRVPAGLWQGAFHFALNGAGPPAKLAVTLRADLGDLRAEAEAHADAPARRISATVTLRHPGAPRLAAGLGLPDARAWLDDGSFALLTHLALSPNHARAVDFSLAAGALQVGGAVDAVLSPGGLAIDGDIEAPGLALPAWPVLSAGMPQWGWLRGVQGRLSLRAARVLSGLVPVATNATATLRAGAGVAMVDDLRADLPRGHAAGAWAVDTGQSPPAFSLQAGMEGVSAGTLLPDMPVPPGLALRGGTMDATAALYGRGDSPAAWRATCSGTVHLDVHGGSLAGADLAAAGAALSGTAPGMRARLQHALATGATAPLDGKIDAVVTRGLATLEGSRLIGPAGAWDLAGTVDAATGILDLRLGAVPDVPAAPRLGLALSGAWNAARTTIDLGGAGVSKAPAKHARRRGKGK